MHSRLPVRPAAHNAAASSAAPAAFHLFLVRPMGLDALTILLRGEHEGPLPATRAHALQLLQAGREIHGPGLAVQVVDASNGALRLVASMGGAFAAGGVS